MLRYVIPTPRVARPLAMVDPYRHRQAYVRILSALYHAEAAALEGFGLLDDPAFVQANDLFARASQKLVADEARHLKDIEDLLALLGAKDGPLPPNETEKEFWTAWRSGKLFALPFKPQVAALFCLFSEGLGYAVLHHLAEVTTDPEFRARLMANVEDEKSHLRLSMTILRRALQADQEGFLTDFAVYSAGYAMLAKKAMRDHRDRLEDLGLDYDVVVGSSLQFVCSLLLRVVEDAGCPSLWWGFLDKMSRFAQEHPSSIELLYFSLFLPSPPLAPKLVYAWGKAGLVLGKWRAAKGRPKLIAIPGLREAA